MTKSEKTVVFREQSERIYLLCCWTVVSQGKIKTFSDNLGPVHTFLNSFLNGDVCYGLAYRPRLSGENGHGKRVFQKPSPAFCTRVDGWKRRFFLKRSHHGVGYQYERIKRFRKRKKLSWILF